MEGKKNRLFSKYLCDWRARLEILEQKKVKGLALKANKDCQILLFDFHVVYRTPKVSFPRRISENDGEQAVSTLHSNLQPLFSLIKAIVLCRCRPRILKSLLIAPAPRGSRPLKGCGVVPCHMKLPY